VSFTGTAARTDTYSEARARIVMLEVGADFYCLAAASLVSFETASKWTEELNCILQHEAAHGFQVQFRCEGYSPLALEYRVSSDGSILESSKAGGINYFALPAGTRAFLFVNLNYGASKIEPVRQYLTARGWGFNGRAVEGPTVRDRAFSKDGYGVTRSKVGAWP
jgi:hypothetical protein